MLYGFDINTDTLASLIRCGIAKGKVCASSRKYLETLIKLRNRYKDAISFNDSNFALSDFKVSDSFYDILKRKEPDLYRCLVDPYVIINDLVEDRPGVFINGLKEIASILRRFSRIEELLGFLDKSYSTLDNNDCMYLKETIVDEANYVKTIVDSFFRIVLKNFKRKDSSIVEVVKQTFLQLVYDHIAEIKLYTERNYHVTLHSVMGTGIVYKIYVAINNAKDTFKPFEVVPYDVSESDFVSYALQTLQHTGNFGIAVKILDTAFLVVVPSNRLDIVKC